MLKVDKPHLTKSILHHYKSVFHLEPVREKKRPPKNLQCCDLDVKSTRMGHIWRQVEKLAQDRITGENLLAAYTPEGVRDIKNINYLLWNTTDFQPDPCRWQKDGRDLRQYIRFKTVVRDVHYNTESGDFTVKTKNLIDDREEPPERFTHVVVAVGIFNTPNVPNFDGMDTFRGRILHAHDFRDAEEFRGKRLLMVGAGLSAEDIAITCKKFGAKNVICSWRSKPLGLKWPEGIEERPLLQTIHNNTVVFKDKTQAEIDAIILCTGYIFHFPFLPNEMRPKREKIMYLYPPNLYKGIVWIKGCDRRLLYLGTYGQTFAVRSFDVQALWACKFIMNTLPENKISTDEMENDAQKWRRKALKTENLADFHSDYLTDLTLNTGHCEGIVKAKTIYKMSSHHKEEDILTYRGKRFTSLYTGILAASPRKSFMEEFDDSFDSFVT